MLATVLAGLVAMATGAGPLAASTGPEVLTEVLSGLSPQITDVALSATFVRRTYDPSTDSREDANRAPTRVLVSKALLSSSAVKESVAEGSLQAGPTLQTAQHYVHDGTTVTVYSGPDNTAAIRRGMPPPANPLAAALQPDLAVRAGKFVSRGAAAFAARLAAASADVTTERTTWEGHEAVVLAAEYSKAESQRKLRLVCVPAYGYRIVELSEADAEGRAVLDVKCSDMKELRAGGKTMWLPTHIAVQRYQYQAGAATVQLSTLEIMEPALVTVTPKDFSINFPPDAKMRRLNSMERVLDQSMARSLASIGDVARGDSQSRGGIDARSHAATRPTPGIGGPGASRPASLGARSSHLTLLFALLACAALIVTVQLWRRMRSKTPDAKGGGME